eukprot:225509-Pelagomonas_calceolata.AAC.2
MTSTNDDELIHIAGHKIFNYSTWGIGMEGEERLDYVGSRSSPCAIRGKGVPRAEAPCLPSTKRSERRSMGMKRVTAEPTA